MKWMRYLSLICLSLFPQLGEAVEITEIAWMGTDVSANHEWIELYTAEPVDVNDWILTDGTNLNITLDGVLPAGYSVLERTSDATVNGTAWQIYVGSLVNSGATLSLYDAAGGLVDRIIGGEDWQSVGGDNTTKDTAQLYQGTWTTAPATPGAGANFQAAQTNTSADQNTSSNKTSSKTTTKNNTNGTQAVQLTLPDVTLQLDVKAPELIYVHQPISLSVDASGVGPTIEDSLQYTWNFGNGMTALGQDVSYSYDHPGNYVVVVAGEYKRQKQFARHEVVVLPVALAIERTSFGDIAVQNVSQTEIDIAGYRLHGTKSFEFPKYTILLPQSQIVVAASEFSSGIADVAVGLYDQADAIVAMDIPQQLRQLPAAAPASEFISQSSQSTATLHQVTPEQNYVSLETVTNTAASSAESDDDGLEELEIPLLASTTTPEPTQPWSRYGLVALLLAGVAAVYVVPRRTEDSSPWA